jgi:nitrite reductase/ring-hydroxylating ferredoxin subunit
MRGQTIVCPVHARDFNVFTGKCFRFREEIASYPVRVQNGILESCL